MSVCVRAFDTLRDVYKEDSYELAPPWRKLRATINTTRKATGGLPSHQTPFDPQVNGYETYKPLLTVLKRAPEHRRYGFPNVC